MDTQQEQYPLHEIGFVVHVDDYRDFMYTVERMRTEKLKQLMGCRERLWT
jgi:hypothetical protein